MTVMSFKPHDSESTESPLSHFACYLGTGYENATVDAVRAYITSRPSEDTLEPTVASNIFGIPLKTVGCNVTLYLSQHGRFGAFNCTATDDKSAKTTIMTIFMRSDGKLHFLNILLTLENKNPERRIKFCSVGYSNILNCKKW